MLGFPFSFDCSFLSLAGLNLYSNQMIYSMNNINFTSNTFVSDSISLTELIFNGKLFSYLPDLESSFYIKDSTISSNSLFTCTYSSVKSSPCASTSSSTISTSKSYLMTFDYLSSVTILNMQSQDNSLTLLNYIKTLNLTLDRLSCGNTFLSDSGTDHSCIKLSDFSTLTAIITNS